MNTANTDASTRPFSVGDTLTHRNRYGDEVAVNFRGYTGDERAVVVMNGFQMMVPVSELHRAVA